jgi:type II secretory pathway pseudopilin PulG
VDGDDASTPAADLVVSDGDAGEAYLGVSLDKQQQQLEASGSQQSRPATAGSKVATAEAGTGSGTAAEGHTDATEEVGVSMGLAAGGLAGSMSKTCSVACPAVLDVHWMHDAADADRSNKEQQQVQQQRQQQQQQQEEASGSAGECGSDVCMPFVDHLVPAAVAAAAAGTWQSQPAASGSNCACKLGGIGDGSAVQDESTSSEEAGRHDANGSDPIVCSSSTKQPLISMEQLEVLLELQNNSSMLSVARVQE